MDFTFLILFYEKIMEYESLQKSQIQSHLFNKHAKNNELILLMEFEFSKKNQKLFGTILFFRAGNISKIRWIQSLFKNANAFR